MKKNNKGFTLIELLAAIIILGLLTMLGLPTITRVIQGGKDKIYVSDAKRMIAQTEYKIKVNSSSIELPSEGSCIVVGLQYLDASDFDSPPNDGTYMLDQSYTIVKNTGRGLEYSVRLVEKLKKNGYKGVELSTQTALNVNSGLSRVKSFKDSEVSTDMLNSGLGAFNDPIKKNIGDNYCATVNEIYNSVDLVDSSVQTGNEPPKITSASFVSENNSIYNTIKSTLNIKADDADNARKDLSVCTSFVSYDDAVNSCSSYGNQAVFSKEFDFGDQNTVNPVSSYYADDGENPEYTLYIYVKDPSGGYAKKKLTYQVHKNEAPVIDLVNTKVTSRPGDPYNGATARIVLYATDDLDSVGNLKVCISQDNMKECKTDDEFVNYSDLFGNGSSMDYQLEGVSEPLDGSSHSIELYVKDSLDAISNSAKYIYTLHKPSYTITGDGTDGSHIRLKSIAYKNVIQNSLKVEVSFSLLDSLGAVSDKDVIISERVSGTQDYIHRKAYKYNGGAYTYLFGNVNGSDDVTEYTYDGKENRILDVMVCPSRADKKPNNYNPAQCNREEVTYSIHKNESPTIKFGRFCSDENLCPNGYICNAGVNTHFESLRSEFIITVEDDIDTIKLKRSDPSSGLKWCISESASGCSEDGDYADFTYEKSRIYLPNNPFTSINLNYDTTTSYNIFGKYTFTGNSKPNPYGIVDPYGKEDDNKKRNIFIFVKDSYGAVSVASSRDNYELYTNQPPFINYLEITDGGTTGVQSGSKNISIKPIIFDNEHYFQRDDFSGYDYLVDDLTENKYVAYKLYSDNVGVGLTNKCHYNDQYQIECVYAELTRDQINEYKNNPSTNWNDILTFDKILSNGFPIDLDEYGFKYNGEVLTFKLELIDEQGLTSNYDLNYALYSNKPPRIERAEIVDSEPACDSCGESGGYTIDLDISLSDDIDDENKLSICVSDNPLDCNNENNYKSYVDLFKDNYYKYTFSGIDGLTPYNGQTKTLTIVARDSLLDKSYETLFYTVYDNQPPTILRDPIISSASSDYHSTDAIAKVDVDDDLGNLFERVCYRKLNSDDEEIGDMVCDGDFKPYSKEFRFNLGVSNYSGESYNVYVIIKDAYDEIVSSNPIRYTTYNDQKPIIDSVSGRHSIVGYSSDVGRVSFKAHDFGDNYKVCITKSSTGSGCNYTGNSYDGSNKDENDYTYSFGSNSKDDTYYIFIKDNHGKISDGKSFKFTKYTNCSSYNSSMIKYEYQKNDSSEINSDTCKGRCYYWNEETSNGKVVKPASDTSNIKARYKQTISYRDTFNDTAFCNSSVDTNVTLTCGSVECFNDGSTYNNHIAIGLVDHIATESWTYEKNGEVHTYEIGSHYFKVYTTQYTPGARYITLYDTGNRVPLDDIDYYNYENENTHYYRVLDKDGITSDYVNTNVSFKYKLIEQQNANSISVGDVVKAGTEEFYVISSNSSVTKLLAKYNLSYGDIVDADTGKIVINSYHYNVVQDVDYAGKKNGLAYYKGVEKIHITSSVVSEGGVCGYAFERYHSNLTHHGLSLDNKIRLINRTEVNSLCNPSCPTWLVNTSYWTGSYASPSSLYGMLANSGLTAYTNDDLDENGSPFGCRPVVEVNTNEIGK